MLLKSLLGYTTICSAEQKLERSYLMVSCMAHFSALKMVATSSTETSVGLQRTTWQYIPVDRTLHNHHYINLICYVVMLLNIPLLQLESSYQEKQLKVCGVCFFSPYASVFSKDSLPGLTFLSFIFIFPTLHHF
jgi:hypothetical protein